MTFIQKVKGKNKIVYSVNGKKYEFPLQNSYGSHLPLLLDTVSQIKLDSVLEFGCGECSTPILAQAKHHEIVEQGTVAEYDLKYTEWVRQNFPNAIIHFAPGKDAWRHLPFQRDHYDLVFIDSYEYSRVDIANWAQYLADVIILHDTEPEAVCYGWERLNIPFNRFDYKEFIPNSTVFHKNLKFQ